MITILFYPELLQSKPLSRIYRILKEQGLKSNIVYHNDPTKPYDLHMFWSYTKCQIEPDELTLKDKDVINRGCWNVSKEKVNDIFNDIRIDPTKHFGICVEKLDQQAKHKQHSLIVCPTVKREGYIYQRYIADQENGMFVKYRIYYADGIQVILKQVKPGLFTSDYIKHEVIDKRRFFTKESENEFTKKCKKFGIDFGEIEFISDEGNPIIIDVNNCVGGGGVKGLSGTELHKQIDDLFITFIKQRYDQSS
jgi:hypothetical protein